MIYVISISGNPLMPTKNKSKVRILLKNKKAKVVENKPFTIQLLYQTTEHTQDINLGIDSGYAHIGFSAVTETEELIAGEVQLLKGQKQRLEEKAMHRRNRRSRLRYRKVRFDNRAKPKKWLAPSIEHKLDSHKRFISKLEKFLPITGITIEVANFDSHKLKDSKVSGKGYQEGEQSGFFNLREYIFHRDKHTCQVCCERDAILRVHHIGYWKKDSTNRPANLMTVCNKCHSSKNHAKDGVLWGLEPINKGFREATFMTLIRHRLVESIGALSTYGYITKSRRIELGLDKSHANDAFVIAGGSTQERVKFTNYKQIRRNNRSLEKFYDAKYIDIRSEKRSSGKELFSGRTTRNKNLNSENLHKYRGEKLSKGRRSIRKKRYFYQPNDLVKFEEKVFVVKGTHNKGSRVILRETGKSIGVKEIEPYKFTCGIARI